MQFKLAALGTMECGGGPKHLSRLTRDTLKTEVSSEPAFESDARQAETKFHVARLTELKSSRDRAFRIRLAISQVRKEIVGTNEPVLIEGVFKAGAKSPTGYGVN